MLSASAARIGRVSSIIPRREVLEQHRQLLTRRTSLQPSKYFSDSTSSSTRNRNVPGASVPLDFKALCLPEDVSRRSLSTSTLYEKRHQSSVRVATFVDEDSECVSYFPKNTSHVTPPIQKTQYEDWMINLGRGRNKVWLTGPRPKDWFTGLNPELCPGKVTLPRPQSHKFMQNAPNLTKYCTLILAH